MIKGITILSVIVGIAVGLVTLLGAYNGQPDIVIQLAEKGIRLIDSLLELSAKCLTDCFNE